MAATATPEAAIVAAAVARRTLIATKAEKDAAQVATMELEKQAGVSEASGKEGRRLGGKWQAVLTIDRWWGNIRNSCNFSRNNGA